MRVRDENANLPGTGESVKLMLLAIGLRFVNSLGCGNVSHRRTEIASFPAMHSDLRSSRASQLSVGSSLLEDFFRLTLRRFHLAETRMRRIKR